VEPAARVAVFDNDGTLWTEKPMVIQLDFTVRRLGELAAAEPTLRNSSRTRRPTRVTCTGSGPRWSSTNTATTPT